MSIRLGAADEGNGDPLAVRFGRSTQRRFEGTVGATLRRPIRLGDSLLTPFGRVEHRWRSIGSSRETLGYADTIGGDVGTALGSSSDGNWALGGGARLAVGPAQLMIEYSTASDRLLGFEGSAIRVHLGVDF